MKKTYISSLLVALIGAHTIQAQESLDDVFASLDAASGTESAAAPAAAPAPAAVEAAQPATVEATAVEAAPVSNVDAFFARGVAEYKAGELAKSEALFEAVLDLDPYNRKAMDYLKRLAGKKSYNAAVMRKASRAQSLAEVDAKWNSDINNLSVPVIGDSETAMTGDEIAIAAMTARLKAIKIPSLDFREANINDVSLFLTETARRQDPAKTGVNIMLLGMDDSIDANNITISIRDMSLYEALAFITEMAELQFDVRAKSVAIMPVNFVPVENLVRVTIDVMPEVGEKLTSAAGGDGGGVDDLFGDSSASTVSGPTDVSGFFSVVKWPEGTKATYEPNFSKLFVLNTKQNIAAVEDILSELEDKAIKLRSQQVEIEAKFVEYNEGALEELGFEWTLYDDGEFAGFGLDQNGTYYRRDQGYSTEYDSSANASGTSTLYADPITGYSQIDTTPGQSLFGNGQRNNTTAFEAIQSGVLSAMGGAPAAMMFHNNGKFPLDLAISALEQEGTADVLSAPRVTTKSGNEAIIRVVEVHRYPQDYDVETGQRTAPVVKPQDWEDYDLGVVLKVTPVVDAENNTIDLDLQPDITKFKGYDDYIVGYNSYETGDSNSFNPQGNGLPLLARMPYFETRTVQTQVTIADGSTVIMGGLVDERTETFRDQVPFLGDIPYLGRLFRTEGSRSSKKNLVISVKATQVDDRGMTSDQRKAATAAQQAAN